MKEDIRVRLMDLPTTIRGYCYHDDDGEEFVVLNSRLPWEANKETWIHELRHIRRGDLWNITYREYKEG